MKTGHDIDSVVTRAQSRAEREHNAGEVQTCGGCRWWENTIPRASEYGWCGVPDWNELKPMRQWRHGLPTTDATDCEAYEQK